MRRHGGGGQEGQEGERSPARPAAGPGRGVGVPPGGRAGGRAAEQRAGTVVRWACGSRRKCRAFPGEGGPLCCSPRAGSDALPGGPPSPRAGLGPQRKWAQRGARRWPGLCDDRRRFHCPLGFVLGCPVEAEMALASRPVRPSTCRSYLIPLSDFSDVMFGSKI